MPRLASDARIRGWAARQLRRLAADRAGTRVPLTRLPIDDSVAVYLHVPFCGARCRYCSFNTERAASRADISRYFEALRREIAGWSDLLGPVAIRAVYIGGGTPTFAPASCIAEVLSALQDNFRGLAEAQITIEANPESIHADKLALYRQAGVDRVSVGAQTFDDDGLRRLGRRHRGQDVLAALERVVAAGIDEVSIDLMYALPGQTRALLARDLDRAATSVATHVSLFPFIPRPKTPLQRARRHRPLALYHLALERLGAAGFSQYTTEDFTRSGVRCEYQMHVWRPPPTPCLGLGAGALSAAGDCYWNNLADIDAYIAATRDGLPVADNSARQLPIQPMLDHLLMGARCLGVDGRGFTARFGRSPLSVIGPLPWLARALGLASSVDRFGGFSLSPAGRYYGSLLWSHLILEHLAQAS